MFGKLGLPELAIIVLIILIIFGAGRLPEVGGAIGKGIREFRRSSREPNERQEIAEPPARSSVEPPAPNAPSVSEATVDCPQCRASNSAGAKFCSECGTPLQARVN